MVAGKTVWLLNTAQPKNPQLGDPKKPEFKKLAKQILALPGCAGMNPHSGGILWVFDTKHQAKEAQTQIPGFGAVVDPNICRGHTDEQTVCIEGVDN